VTPRDEPPGGDFRASLGDRLIGLALILGGLIGFGAVYLLWLYAPAAMPAPPGLPRGVLPIASPLNCMLPVTAIGSSLLVLIGLKRLIVGE
jgi:hypothetical protein